MGISLRRRVLLYKKEKKRFLAYERRGIPLYGSYYFSKREGLLYVVYSLCITAFLAFFFYRSPWAILFLSPIGMGIYLYLQKEKGEKRRQRLELEFKDCILSVSANLRAGYSVENAFVECRKDMLTLYGDAGLMQKELSRIQKSLSNNVPMEELLQELGERSRCDGIREFAQVFAIARQSGGRLPDIIQSTAQLIGEEISLKQEIQVAISGRRFEQKIMNIIPFGLVCYIEFGNPGFFDVLYHNSMGQIIMTGCLFIYLAAFCLASHICKIAA